MTRIAIGIHAVLFAPRLYPRRSRPWKAHPSRRTWRGIQPYVVNLFQYEAKHLADDGWLDPLADGLYFWRGKYDKLRGLAEAGYDPADLISQ